MAQSPRGNEVIEFPFVYAYINTGATTSVSVVGGGILHGITVEGGTAGTIVITDDTGSGSGPTIASFASTNAPASYIFDVIYTQGITIVTSAATQITVSYI